MSAENSIVFHYPKNKGKIAINFYLENDQICVHHSEKGYEINIYFSTKEFEEIIKFYQHIKQER
jgi:hypothetical protein